MKKLSLFLFAALFFIFPSVVLAGSVTATGSGITESEAENDALRRAVENAVGVLVDSETLVKNSAVMSDEIYTQSRGFIKNYKVTDRRESGGVWTVTVNAVVDSDPDSKLMTELTRLGIIENRLRNPKIAVYIPESHIRYRVPDPAGETAVIKTLIEAGFSNVTAISPVASGASWASKSYGSVDARDMSEAARFMSADIVVMGEAFSEGVGDPARWLPGRQTSGLSSCRARLEAKMYIARSGQIIAADGKYGSGLDISEAVASKKAIAAAGEAMGNFLVEEIVKLGAGTRQGMEIIAIGSDFTKISEVQSALGAVNGVKNVRLTGYEGGRGVFSVNYGGAPATLFRALAALMERDIVMRESSYNTLTIEVH